MSDINGHVADTPNDFVSLPVGDFAVLTDLRSRVAYTLAQYNASHEDTKSKKKAFDAARDQFEREFDRIVAKTNGPDLPLFQSQTDAIAAAEHDPAARELLDRLIGAGHTNLNLLIVFGYTEDERHQVRTYLDARDAQAGDVEVPAFLLEQHLTDAEKDELIHRLNAEGLVVSADTTKWTPRQWQTVNEWLLACEAVKAEKGEALTMADLPSAPGWLLVDPDEDGDPGENHANTGASAEA